MMRDQGIGDVLVQHDGSLGIVTDRDIVTRAGRRRPRPEAGDASATSARGTSRPSRSTRRSTT